MTGFGGIGPNRLNLVFSQATILAAIRMAGDSNSLMEGHHDGSFQVPLLGRFHPQNRNLSRQSTRRALVCPARRAIYQGACGPAAASAFRASRRSISPRQRQNSAPPGLARPVHAPPSELLGWVHLTPTLSRIEPAISMTTESGARHKAP